MQVRDNYIFSEKAATDKAEALVLALEAVIDAYLKLHPDMRKSEAKQSRNLSNLINMHARARDTLQKPMQDMCGIEKYTQIIKLIENELRQIIRNYAEDNKKISLPEDLLNHEFAEYLNNNQRGHHRSRLLCMLAAEIYALTASADLPKTSLARNEDDRILRVEEVQAVAKKDAYQLLSQHLRKLKASKPEKTVSENDDLQAIKMEEMIEEINERVKILKHVYALLHSSNKKTKHGDDLSKLADNVSVNVEREVKTSITADESQRQLVAVIRLSNIFNLLQDALLDTCKAKLKDHPGGFAPKKHPDINSLIKHLNDHPSKSHFTRILCLMLRDIYQKIDTHEDLGVHNPFKSTPHPGISDKDRRDLELLEKLVYGVKPPQIHTVNAYEYSKIFNEYKLDTLPTVNRSPTFTRSE